MLRILSSKKDKMPTDGSYKQFQWPPFLLEVARAAIRIGLQVFLLATVSCADGSDIDNRYPSVEFNVNQDLLSSPTSIDKSFSIELPASWSELDEKSLLRVRQTISGDSASFLKIEVIKVFRSDGNASCIISKILNGSFSFDMLDTGFEELLRESFKTQDVTRAAFNLNGCNTVQYRILSDNHISFKLFYRSSKIYYQIDYFIPTDIYNTEIHSVESSIGSIIATTNRKEAIEQ